MSVNLTMQKQNIQMKIQYISDYCSDLTGKEENVMLYLKLFY